MRLGGTPDESFSRLNMGGGTGRRAARSPTQSPSGGGLVSAAISRKICMEISVVPCSRAAIEPTVVFTFCQMFA